MRMAEESFLMGVFRKMGWVRMAWSLRRMHCPVAPEALVLEVGSGGNPYARSNVLLDAFESTQQRHWVPLVADRPTVIGAVECLPFRDKSFDFVIASHVLEHSAKPELFLNELQRVARAGYIEVPDALMERLNPYRDHRLEITLRDGKLVLRKKGNWLGDPELVDLYEPRAKKWISGETIPKHPFDFHVRYYWNESINYIVKNPDVDSSWEALTDIIPRRPTVGFRSTTHRWLQKIARTFLSQGRRNANLKLDALLACPECRGDKLDVDATRIRCESCQHDYPVRNGMPVMFSTAGRA